MSFAGLRFSVPANWPINQTQVTPGLGAICRQQGVAFAGTTVTLSTDRHPLLAVFCPRMSPTPQQPENGVQVDSGLRTEPTVTLSFSAHCLDLNGLTACPATSPAYSILVLRVTVPGRRKPDFVSIGLAGNGMVARTILYSLRAASDSAVTPASFLARAKAGIEGTFSAVYKLSAPSSSTESDATVTVAQRAASGSTSWPGGKPGEWSYRLTYADGSTVEWLVRGNLLVDLLAGEQVEVAVQRGSLQRRRGQHRLHNRHHSLSSRYGLPVAEHRPPSHATTRVVIVGRVRPQAVDLYAPSHPTHGMEKPANMKRREVDPAQRNGHAEHTLRFLALMDQPSGGMGMPSRRLGSSPSGSTSSLISHASPGIICHFTLTTRTRVGRGHEAPPRVAARQAVPGRGLHGQLHGGGFGDP